MGQEHVRCNHHQHQHQLFVSRALQLHPFPVQKALKGWSPARTAVQVERMA
jgi:hypothetical protein